MATIFVLLAVTAGTVAAILRILGVPLTSRRGRSAKQKRAPQSRRDVVRAASSRLLFTLLLMAAGAALLVVIAIEWIGDILRKILS